MSVDIDKAKNVKSIWLNQPVAIVAVVAAAATGPVAERTIVVFGPFSSVKEE